jgi:hypothetical protein
MNTENGFKICGFMEFGGFFGFMEFVMFVEFIKFVGFVSPKERVALVYSTIITIACQHHKSSPKGTLRTADKDEHRVDSTRSFF